MPSNAHLRKSSVPARSTIGFVASVVALLSLTFITLSGDTSEIALAASPRPIPQRAPPDSLPASAPRKKKHHASRGGGAAASGGSRSRVSGIVFLEPPMRRDDGPTSWFDPRSDPTPVRAGSFAEALPTATLEAFATAQSSPLCTFVWVRSEPYGGNDTTRPSTAVTRSAEYERTLAEALRRYEMPEGSCSGATERATVVLVVRTGRAVGLSQLHLAATYALLDLLDGKFATLVSSNATAIAQPQAALLIDVSFVPMIAAEILLQDIATAFTGHEHSAVGCALVDGQGSQPTVRHAGFDVRVHQRAGGAALVPVHQGVHLDDLPADASPDALPPTCLALRAADAGKVAKQPALGGRSLDADSTDVGRFAAAAWPLIASLRGAGSIARAADGALRKVGAMPEIACPLRRLTTALADGERAVREFEVLSDTSAQFADASVSGAATSTTAFPPSSKPFDVDYHGQLQHRCTHDEHLALSAVPVSSIPALVRHADGQVGMLRSGGGDNERDVQRAHQRRGSADFFGRVNISSLAGSVAFLTVSQSSQLAQTWHQIGVYRDLLATLNADARTAACADCSDRCNPETESEDVRELVELCRGSRQTFRGLLAAVKDVSETVTANARRLSEVATRVRGACGGGFDARGWLRVSRALQDAGLVAALPMAASVVAAPLVGAFAGLPYQVRPASLVRQPGYLAASLGPDDVIGAAYEAEVRAEFATLGARVHWAPPCACCGFTVEVAWILQGLRDRLDVVLAQHPRCFCTLRNERNGNGVVDEGLWQSFASPTATRWQTFLASRTDPDDVVEIAVHHWDPIQEGGLKLAFSRDGGKSLAAAPDVRVLRTMYEFSRVPTSWNEKLLSERFDEIWVPGDVVKQAYVNSGIPAGLFFVVPEAIDVELYSPNSPAPKFDLPLPKGPMRTFVSDAPPELMGNTFKFCAVSKYELRKGWDVLFRAFFDAFDNSSTASLHIRTQLTYKGQVDGATSLQDSDAISRHIMWEYGARKAIPPFEVITASITDDGVVSLYKGCDAFVLPSRGEGWGLPMMQAMAMGLPTITTKGSGMDAFATPDTAVLVEADTVRIPAEARKVYGLPSAAEWLEPRHDALVTALRRVAAMSVKERQALGGRARAHIVKNFRPSVVADIIARRVVELEKRVRSRWAAEGPPPLQGGEALRRWNCTATFATTPAEGHN